MTAFVDGQTVTAAELNSINAATATALQTPRAINGVNFDGTAAITIPPTGAVLSADLANTTDPTKGAALVGSLQAGTGAVGRTVQSKLRDLISAKDFGAVGDGVTDDRVAIQAALNAAGTNGGSVYLPPGVFLVSPSGNTCPGSSGIYCLLIPGGVKFLGQSRGATIKCTTDAATVLCAAGTSSASHVTDIVIDGITVQCGDSSNNGLGRGIFLFRADRCTVRNCEIIGARLGLQVDRLSSDTAYNVGNQIKDNIVRNTFGTTVGNGSGLFASGCDGLQFTGNQLLEIAEHGVYLNQDMRNCLISNNVIVLAINTNGNNGVQCYSSAASPNITKVVISGNSVTGGVHGILLSCATPYVLQCTIADNVISGCSINGIVTSNTRECSISGNRVTACGLGGGNGMECDLGVSMSILGNTSSFNGYSGIMLATTIDSSIVGNHFFNNDQLGSGNYGIRLASTSTRIMVVGNTCTDYQNTKTQKYGIQIDANCTGCELTHNMTAGNVTADILDQVPSTPLANRTLIHSRTATAQEVIAPGKQDVVYGNQLVSLGAVGTVTLGSSGGSGPATLAQNCWMRWVDNSGSAFWVPVWR